MTTPSSSKQPEFSEVETWRAPSNDLNVGYYSAIDPFSWESCRERFSSAMRKKSFKAFYIVHAPANGEHIANFIFKTEEILNLPERTTYNKTTCNQILRINMTDFWMSTYIRRSFFTILPRLGNFYNTEKDNYEKILFAPTTSPAHGWSTTGPAIRRFLYGFTSYDAPDPDYNGSSSLETSGWCKLFYKSDSWKKLIKEEEKKKEKRIVSPIAMGKLWG